MSVQTNKILQFYCVLWLTIINTYHSHSQNVTEYRELNKLLSDQCLTNTSDRLIVCTKNFQSRIMALNGQRNYDNSDEASKQTECCALWKWKECAVRTIKSATDMCDTMSDVKAILAFPSKTNSSIASMFIASYCADYLEDSENCGPFWTQWKVVVTTVFGSIIALLFGFCCVDCIRYKVKLETQKRQRNNEKDIKNGIIVTRF